MKKKISVGSWAYIFAGNEILLPELCEKLHSLQFDGVSMGGFKPHAHPELYDTPEKKEGLKKLLADHALSVAEYACDLWSLDGIAQSDEWVALFEVNAKFCRDMGWGIIRVDSGTPPVLPDGMSYDKAKSIITDNFKRVAKIAQKYGLEVVWEFEPGFMINEPKMIIEVLNAVGEPNFSLLFDTCHAHMSAVHGARHILPDCTLNGGVEEFAELCKGKIGIVHLIDSDGKLNGEGTSVHAPFGTGEINFDSVIPALLNKAGYAAEWWAIDLCEWPDPWPVTADSKAFVDKLNEKYCK
ncbi:MAG TPA: sugar phosphate isomerase/epimerase [Clostridiales bacterium]|nr:sugar phosphate isomerase/epimerase [Clostridiales bacterium]